MEKLDQAIVAAENAENNGIPVSRSTVLIDSEIKIDDNSKVAKTLSYLETAFTERETQRRGVTPNGGIERNEKKISLQSEMDNRYQNFFKNHIFQCDTNFYCYLCNVIFTNESLALEHLSLSTHRLWVETELPWYSSLSLRSAEVTYRYCVNNGLFARNSGVECRICDLVDIGWPNISWHIDKTEHKIWKSAIVATLMNRIVATDTSQYTTTLEAMGNSAPKTSANASLDSSQKNTAESNDEEKAPFSLEHGSTRDGTSVAIASTREAKIVVESRHRHSRGDDFDKIHNDNSHCRICNVAVANNDYDAHVAEKKHAKYRRQFEDNRISWMKGKDYYCGYCECVLISFRHIAEHVIGNRHRHSRGNRRNASENPVPPTTTKFAPKVSTSKSLSTEKTTSERFINKLPNQSFFCNICNAHLVDREKLDAHLTEDRHAKLFAQYGCDKISLREGTTYYCSCCRCKISGLDNVYLHLKGLRHASSLNVPTETQKPLSWNRIVSSLSNDLEKSTTKSRPVEPKDGKKSSKKLLGFKWLFEPAENLRGETARCPVCADELLSAVRLHAHLARHFSAIFGRPSETRRLDAKKNENSSEAIFDSDGKLVNTGLAMDGEKTFVKREEKVVNIARVLRELNFEKDFIYEMEDKLMDIELGMKLLFDIDDGNVYCLVCQKIIATTQSRFDHLQSLDHCAYLDKIENDHRLFADFPEQLSDLDLALEYMEEIAIDAVHCRACERSLDNVDAILREHIDGKKHKKKCEETRMRASQKFELAKPRLRCDWYRVQIYWCVICFKTYRSEVNFVKHLESQDHAFVMKTKIHRKRKMILEFCEPCALLWYGYRCTYAYHCGLPTHQWLVRDGHYAWDELPEAVEDLLLNPEDYVEKKIKYYTEVSARERDKERTLVRDLENTVKLNFPRGKAYAFGSRLTGLGSPDSDLDVFLDCGDMYDGNASSMEQISKCIIEVHECLSKEPESWDVDELLTNCRSPIIKARHRVTGLLCDISFQNGLAVENTKLIKSFNDASPSCRKMILFLKQWLTLTELTGSHAITSYALCWCVIYFLQKESILPSIARMIANKGQSQKIAGWEVGVDRNFTHGEAESNFTLKSLLTRFFDFYANFDFRYEVACPVLGEAIKKRVFAIPKNLPEEMAAYAAYVENTKSPAIFRIDSPMCIQDPFDLQHNITKAVSKVCLNRFRNYCCKSLNILCSAETQVASIGESKD